MKYLLITLFLLTACASNIRQNSTSDIIGTWCELDFKSSTCIGYMIYFSSGEYYGYGVVQGYPMTYISKGDWNISNGVSCIMPKERTVQDLDTGRPIDLKLETEHYCDEVVSLDNKKFIYISHNDGEVYTMYKVSGEYKMSLPLMAEPLVN